MSNERKVDLSKTLMELVEEGWTLKELLDAIGFKPATEQETKQRELHQRITSILQEIGVPPRLTGYRYIRRAIEMMVEEPQLGYAITKQLYPMVAKEFGTNQSSAERVIRHAVEVAWDRGDLEIMQKYFGNTVSSAKGKPTNGEFIAMIAEHLHMEGYGKSK